MNTKQMYREFFRIKEQTTEKPIESDPRKIIGISTSMKTISDPATKEKIRKAAEKLKYDTGVTLMPAPNNPDLLYFNFSSGRDHAKALAAVDDFVTANKLASYQQHVVKPDPDQIAEGPLTNKMTDYSGGVVFKLHDPSTYPMVKSKVVNYAKENNLYLITAKFNPNKSVGYFYFRVGEDITSEAQKIQGYMSSLIEVVKYKFKVLNQ